MKYFVSMISGEGVVAVTCEEQQVEAVVQAVQGVIEQLNIDVAFISVEEEASIQTALMFAQYAHHSASTN